MYIISTVIYIQQVKLFFGGIKYFNPSRKYFSTTLIIGMSTAMHRILVKKLNETCEVQLTSDFWSNRQMRSYIGVTVHFISN